MKAQLAFFLLLFTAFAAADICQGQDTSLMLEDGKVLLGEVVECSADSVKFKYKLGDKETVASFDVSHLDPHSFYNIRREFVGDDAAAQITLAVFCADNGMPTQAMAHAQRAKYLDPKLYGRFEKEKLPALKEKWAAKLLAKAKEAVAKKDLETAEENCSTILTYLSETKVAEETKALIVKVGNELMQMRQKEWEENDGPDVLVMKNGRILKGTVIESDESSVKFQQKRGPGAVTSTLAASKIEPHSFFQVRNKAVGDDSKARLDLVKFCIRHGMFSHAYYQYEYLKAMDPEFIADFEKNELPALRVKLAKELLSSASQSLEKGELIEAQRDVAFVLTRFDDDEAIGNDARAVMEKVAAAFDKRDTAKATAMVGQVNDENRKKDEARLKLLEPVQKTMKEGRKMNQRALTAKSSSSRTKAAFYASAAKFERAMDMLERMKKEHGEDSRMLSMIDSLEKEAKEHAIGAYVSGGGLLIVRGSYGEALDCANKALAIDPQSSYAQSFRARVEAASADAAGGRWGKRGRRGR